MDEERKDEVEGHMFDANREANREATRNDEPGESDTRGAV